MGGGVLNELIYLNIKKVQLAEYQYVRYVQEKKTLEIYEKCKWLKVSTFECCK